MRTCGKTLGATKMSKRLQDGTTVCMEEIRMLCASVPNQNLGFNLGSAEFPIRHGRASPTSIRPLDTVPHW